MKHEEDLRKLLNGVAFDDTIDPAHKARLKNAVLHAHMSPAASSRKVWLNAAAVIFAIGLGFIITMQIQHEMKTRRQIAAGPATATVRPAELTTVKTPQALPPLWSKDAWERRLANVQMAQRTKSRIIWTSPTQQPTQGEQQ